jgi:hypothetical protein
LVRAIAVFVLHVGRKAAPLDHESRDHAVEHQAVEETGVDIGQEILGRDRCLVLEQLDREITLRSLKLQHDA